MSWDTFADDLLLLAEELRKCEPTERTGERLLAIHGSLKHSWIMRRRMACQLQGIPLPPPRNHGLHPKGCEIHEADIQFEFELGNQFDQERIPVLSSFQVCVRGIAAYDAHLVELEDHWRVDTHIFGNDSRESHPFIHFQRGGHAQTAFAGQPNFVPGPGLPEARDDWRALLQSPGPRIPIPPLCPLLAIDFVIAQHDGVVWAALRNSPEYLAIISRAQSRLWAPFFEGLAGEQFRRKWLGQLLV